MEFYTVRCTKCGAEQMAARGRENWFCGYCGFRFKLSYQQAETAAEPEQLPKPVSEVERRLEQAEELMSAKSFEQALKIYNELTENYPLTYSVWEGLMNCLMEKYISDGCLMNEKNITFDLTGVIKNARNHCHRENRAALEERINGFFSDIDKRVRSGEFHLLSPNDGWSEYGTEKCLHLIKYSHPIMEKLVLDCKSICQHLSTLNIHYGVPHAGGVMNEADISFWYDFRETKPYCGVRVFAIYGRDCFVGFWGEGGSHYYKYYELPVAAADEEQFYSYAASTAAANVQGLTKCPVCSGTQLKIKKETLLGKKQIWKCSVCGSFCVF